MVNNKYCLFCDKQLRKIEQAEKAGDAQRSRVMRSIYLGHCEIEHGLLLVEDVVIVWSNGTAWIMARQGVLP